MNMYNAQIQSEDIITFVSINGVGSFYDAPDDPFEIYCQRFGLVEW